MLTQRDIPTSPDRPHKRGRVREAEPGLARLFGANLDFGKYFEKYARLTREQKSPEIYHAWLVGSKKFRKFTLLPVTGSYCS